MEVISKILNCENENDPLNGLLKNLIDSMPSNISVWQEGKAIYANQGFYKAVGVEPGNLDKLNELIESDSYITIHPDDFDDSEGSAELLKNEIQNGFVFNKEMRMKSCIDSDYRWYNTYVLKSTNPKSKIIIEIDEDIHDKKMYNDKLQKALLEKEKLLNENELLLKEIHHRVKNNFQVISSLLRLQSVKAHSDETKKVLDESRSRVISISKIHEQLYKSHSINLVEICKNIRDITHSLVDVYSGNSRCVRFVYDCHEILLTIDKAIPCMLIINEIVSNSLKYAFDNYNNAEIKIELKNEKDNLIYLSVTDNGKGFPEDYPKNVKSTSLMIVETFAKQLDGKIMFSNQKGAKFTLTFKQ
ncbi:MAG: sensor histidine kinase [Ignavibacteria bacterium]|nr:sensor histidine kinase [Ignavibacteria bacterium]